MNARAKLRHQLAVMADGGGERRVQGSGIVCHARDLGRTVLTPRFIRARDMIGCAHDDGG